MDKNIELQLLECNTTLVETCNRLSKLNQEQNKLLRVLLLKNSSLTRLCATIAGVLSTKINRSWLEEGWLKSLQEHRKTTA